MSKLASNHINFVHYNYIQQMSYISSFTTLRSIDSLSIVGEMGGNKFFSRFLDDWLGRITDFGVRVVIALIFFVLARYLVRFVLSHVERLNGRTRLDPNLSSLLRHVIRIAMYVGVFVVIANIVGFKPVSFAALIASLGVGVGMGLSGQLQNLAGGVIILVTKPFTIGDYIVAQSAEGVVQSLSLFHTIIKSVDNKRIYIPNGALSSGVITNLSQEDIRRNEWSIGICYNEDFERVRLILSELIAEDKRILATPAPVIALSKLSASSVDVLIRAWCAGTDLWDVYFDFNKRMYARFNAEGIDFPFPQLTIHRNEV